MKFRCGDWEKAVNMGFFSVFPAQAGVILVGPGFEDVADGIPRASGGDPLRHFCPLKFDGYSPRKRG